jgi:pyrimidine and pyridine-specific 5'-nucleotidase
MKKKIDDYIAERLKLSPDNASALHQKYYNQHGLTIAGLSHHHDIDPLEFNQKVDDSLPLDDVLSFDAKLRHTFECFDRTKVKLWLFTNAHVTHARRVVRLLGIDDLFEGITYCDYGSQDLFAKPDQRMFEKAEREAGAEGVECFFVDDSFVNCAAGHARGWRVVHLAEMGEQPPARQGPGHQISHVSELPWLFPRLLKGHWVVQECAWSHTSIVSQNSAVVDLPTRVICQLREAGTSHPIMQSSGSTGDASDIPETLLNRVPS